MPIAPSKDDLSPAKKIHRARFRNRESAGKAKSFLQITGKANPDQFDLEAAPPNADTVRNRSCLMVS